MNILSKDEKVALLVKIITWTQKHGVDAFKINREQLIMALSNK
jgi:hypothetical protein